jgi:hypothetical protein
MYIHQNKNWPKFTWDADVITPLLVRHRQGIILGVMQGLGFRLQEETVLKTLTLDVLSQAKLKENN